MEKVAKVDRRGFFTRVFLGAAAVKAVPLVSETMHTFPSLKANVLGVGRGTSLVLTEDLLVQAINKCRRSQTFFAHPDQIDLYLKDAKS